LKNVFLTLFKNNPSKNLFTDIFKLKMLYQQHISVLNNVLIMYLVLKFG